MCQAVVPTSAVAVRGALFSAMYLQHYARNALTNALYRKHLEDYMGVAAMVYDARCGNASSAEHIMTDLEVLFAQPSEDSMYFIEAAIIFSYRH
eukprot:16383-Heterococcus_DN1.PRE.7